MVDSTFITENRKTQVREQVGSAAAAYREMPDTVVSDRMRPAATKLGEVSPIARAFE